VALAYRNDQTYRTFWTYRGKFPAPTPGSIRTQMLAVLATVPALLGETWYYQIRTNNAATVTGTFSTPRQIQCLPSGRTTTEPFENDRGQWMRKEMVHVRMAYTAPFLHIGDQMIDPLGGFWALADSSGDYITIKHMLVRDIPVLVTPNRGSGV
jgi:hypothetical protein